jgi:segregation and condensation protein B
MELKRIIESLIFVSKDPIGVDRLKTLIPEAEEKQIRIEIKRLCEEYRSKNGGVYIAEIAGGYQFRTNPDCKQWIRRLYQNPPLRISRAALETLSIIAYRQPVIRSDIEYIRGVDSGGVIRSLLDLKLIRVLGRKDIPGRPLIYSTTRFFLEIFGLNDIKDLPTLKDIEDLTKERRFPEQPPSPEEEKILT